MEKPYQDSFLAYWPKIRKLPIAQPRTEIILLTKSEFEITFEGVPKTLTRQIEDRIKNYFSLPVFLRTDQSSAKHDWENTCYYDGTKPLKEHLFNIFQFNHCADVIGLRFLAVIIREYIPMASRFTAFWGNMPVNPERRYFIKDGDILCHHPYWIPEAIESCKAKPSLTNWYEHIEQLNYESEEEIKLLSNYALMVASVIDGFWSVDFCKGANGKWYLIDMATGRHSWHPQTCQYSTPPRDLMQQTVYRNE